MAKTHQPRVSCFYPVSNRSRYWWRDIVGYIPKLISIRQFIGEQGADVESPSSRRDIPPWKLCCELVIDVQNEQDLQSGASMQGCQKYECKGVVEGCTLVEAALGCLGYTLGWVYSVPYPSQERVEEEQRAHIGEILSEDIVLVVGSINLTAEDPTR